MRQFFHRSRRGRDVSPQQVSSIHLSIRQGCASPFLIYFFHIWSADVHDLVEVGRQLTANAIGNTYGWSMSLVTCKLDWLVILKVQVLAGGYPTGRPTMPSKVWRRHAREDTLGHDVFFSRGWCKSTGRVKSYGGALVGNFVYTLMLIYYI
jgi:hypothetical protein